MDYIKLKHLYPEAELSSFPFLEKETFRIPYKNKWIHIPTASLSDKEWQLLSLLKQEVEPSKTPLTQSRWHAYLEGKRDTPPDKVESIRMTQFLLEKMDNQFDYSIWIDSIRQLLDPVLDVFFISSDTCLVIQDTSAPTFKTAEMQGLLQTLEDDFSIRTHAYIGHYWSTEGDLKDILREEQVIFQQEVKHLHNQVGSLPEIALRYFTKEALSQSQLMSALKLQIESSEDWRELIYSLWESQGNVSVAAKNLFIHRNTLQYRMDRFYEQTGLSLKNMNELLVCYLLIL
ncbi:Leucine rich protein [Alkalibacterium sp. AK22]|uniref:helix-turn-helix domain-containing protein n=1 Tax=Alkalibacterium sp. AK22 TaxID=1229520 RepID=UPI000446028D|nr:helix-turn-helix domain-containing protein [Alkalibacterium sp. AK22]EXJ23677.1 Leucine rich protein [Alkalibacterium sp. AK22]